MWPRGGPVGVPCPMFVREGAPLPTPALATGLAERTPLGYAAERTPYLAQTLRGQTPGAETLRGEPRGPTLSPRRQRESFERRLSGTRPRLLPDRGVGNRARQAPASTTISDPSGGRPNSSQALPPRRKSYIHTVSSPQAPLQPLLPGAKASSPSSTPKLPSLADADSSPPPMRTRTAAPGSKLFVPRAM